MAPNNICTEHENSDCDCKIELMISQLVEIREKCRLSQSKDLWKEADHFKVKLMKEYSIKIFYRRNGTVGWTKLSEESKPKVKTVSWELVNSSEGRTDGDQFRTSSTCICNNTPLVIATVDVPHYRSRLHDTINHISSLESGNNGSLSPVTSIDMLRFEDDPLIAQKQIVFEGWRQVLLPELLQSIPRSVSNSQPFIFVGEDDLRIASSPSFLAKTCSNTFRDNPDLHVLSLGHAYSCRRQRRRVKNKKPGKVDESSSKSIGHESQPSSSPDQGLSLLQHLKRGGAVHGATLLAIRFPEGVQSLIQAMESIPQRKRSHFDQFLFHSTLHDIGFAFCDPALSGWSEVSETLTCVGSGQRRLGGGRLEQIPPKYDGDVKWIRRKVI